MTNMSLTRIVLFIVLGLVIFLVVLLLLVFLVLVVLIRTIGNEMLRAPTIIAFSLLLVGKSPLHKLVSLSFQPLLVLPHEQSNITNLTGRHFIIFIIT